MRSIKYPYVVVLKPAAGWQFNVFGFILNLVSCIFFTREFVFGNVKNIFLIGGVLLVLGLLAYNVVRMRNGHKVFFNRAYLIAALLLSLIHISEPTRH